MRMKMRFVNSNEVTFFEWRMADRQKKKLYQQIDFLLDTNKKKMNQKMVRGEDYRNGLKQSFESSF